jgi:septum site-determining protein MinC
MNSNQNSDNSNREKTIKIIQTDNNQIAIQLTPTLPNFPTKTDHKPAEEIPFQEKPSEETSSEEKPSEVKKSEEIPADNNQIAIKVTPTLPNLPSPSEEKPLEINTLEEKPSEVKPLEMKALEIKLSEVKPSEINKSDEQKLLQVILKSEEDYLLLILPSETETTTTLTWGEILEQIKIRLSGNERFWQAQTAVHLKVKDRLLDARQLQAIADLLNEFQLQLILIDTNRRATAVTAATAGYSVAQKALFTHEKFTESNPILADTLYLQTTIRSGTEINHPGTVVIWGDVNPGGRVVAIGDILIWGRLKGFAHAGSQGNTSAVIMALQMQPTQLRIADYIARSPENTPNQFYPETAYITPEGIRITRASDFPKMSRK